MSEFNRKQSNNFWHSPIALLALFCILVIFIYNMIGLALKERETAKKKDQILSQIDSLRGREASLNNDIDKLKTSEGIEETIRDKYQVVKEGEKVVTIVDDNSPTNEIEEDTNKDHSFWGWIKKTLGIN